MFCSRLVIIIKTGGRNLKTKYLPEYILEGGGGIRVTHRGYDDSRDRDGEW